MKLPTLWMWVLAAWLFMAVASESVSFKKYGVKPVCTGCGRKLARAEPLWFVGHPRHAVYGRECFKEAAKC